MKTIRCALFDSVTEFFVSQENVEDSASLEIGEEVFLQAWDGQTGHGKVGTKIVLDTDDVVYGIRVEG